MPHAAYYWKAYCEITRSRVWGEAGPRTIALAEIDAYCRLRRVPDEFVDVLLAVMDRCEAVYFEWYQKEAKKQKSKAKMGGKKSPRR